jgi:hypothetical protein
MFQDRAIAQFGRQGRSGDIYRAIKNFHAKAVPVQVGAEFALAICRHRSVSNFNAIKITVRAPSVDSAIANFRGRNLVLGQKVKSPISLLERYAIQLVAISIQRQAIEK